jgi:hypothetical protein
VHLLARYVVLQLDFPKLDGGGDHHVDLAVTVSIFAYLKLDTDVDGQRVLKLANWDIQSSPNNDPLDPNDPLWGHLKPGCEKEELALRLALRDALIIATEILLANVSKNLVQSIPLPPINVVSNLNLVPKDLYIEGHSLAVTGMLSPTALFAQVNAQFVREMEQFRFELTTSETDLDSVLSKAPLKSPAQLDTYMLANVPAYAALNERKQKLVEQRGFKARLVQQADAVVGPLPGNDFFVMLSNNLFDQLAKALLVANSGDCSPWLGVDLGLTYLRGRACYWFSLTNPHGGDGSGRACGGRTRYPTVRSNALRR